MSFFQASMLTNLNSQHFDEQQWVEQIRQTLDEELDEESEVPVTIFSVPKPLMVTDPDSYIPQQVAIGPYHHLRAELYDMERYKVAAAKRHQRELEDLKLKEFVDHLMKYELRIRASYHRPLNYGGEALAWMMAVDATFLFEFFQVCGVKQGKFLTRTPSKLSHLIEQSGNKTVHNVILKDITMMENQIPLFVLRMLLEFQFSALEVADGVLSDMFLGISKELSPFKMVKSTYPQIEIKHCAHLLDYLYLFVVPESEPVFHEEIEINEVEGQEEVNDAGEEPFTKSHVRQLVDEVWKILSSLKNGPVQWVKRIVFSKPLKVVVKLPWTIMSKVPIIGAFKGPIEHMFTTFRNKEKNEDKEDEEENTVMAQKPPLLEEITIPSVTQLLEVGVQFVPTNEGMKGIQFDPKTLTLAMPKIDLDVNSEVVLRNLVAYEACTASKQLFLARYTELMNGIIDTESDVAILCSNGIIINHLKSEKEVADLWNGMSKSIKLTKVPSLDKAIAEVNNYYNGRWKVKCKKMMEQYVFGSWRILTLLAAIALLLLMALQAFCQVYSCSRFLHIKALEPNTE